jgi:hypothetical protein
MAGSALAMVIVGSGVARAQDRTGPMNDTPRLGVTVGSLHPLWDPDPGRAPQVTMFAMVPLGGMGLRADAGVSGDAVPVPPSDGVNSRLARTTHLRVALLRMTAPGRVRGFFGAGYGLYKLDDHAAEFETALHFTTGVYVLLGSGRTAVHGEFGVDMAWLGSRAGIGVSVALGGRDRARP